MCSWAEVGGAARDSVTLWGVRGVNGRSNGGGNTPSESHTRYHTVVRWHCVFFFLPPAPLLFLSHSPGGEHVAAVALGDNGQFLSISATKLFWRRRQWQTNRGGGGGEICMKWNGSRVFVCQSFFFFFAPQTSAVKYFGRIDPRTHTVFVTAAVLIFPRGQR